MTRLTRAPRHVGALCCILPLLMLAFSASAWGQETLADAMEAYRAYQALNRQGKYRHALPYAQRAVDIVRKLRGDGDPNYATGLNNLAVLYESMGEYGKALPICTRALQMRRKLLDDEHPDVTQSLNNLAGLHCAVGEYGKALPLYTQAQQTVRRTLGAEHPHLATSLSNFAGLLAATGHADRALAMMEEVHAIGERQAGMMLDGTAESTQIAFLWRGRSRQETLLSLVLEHFRYDPDAVAIASNALVRSKGRTLEALGRQREALALSGDPAMRGAFERLTQVRQMLARATLAGPGRAGAPAYCKQVRALKER